MDDILDDLVRIALRCERASRRFQDAAVEDRRARLQLAINDLGKAWSGSWLGYHSRVYIRNFRARAPGESWSAQFGATEVGFGAPTVGEWIEYSSEAVIEAIMMRAALPQDRLKPIEEAARAAQEEFDEAKQELLPTVDAILATGDDERIREVRREVTALKCHTPGMDFLTAMMPNGQIVCQDERAAGEGFQMPPHLWLQARVLELSSYGERVRELGLKARYLQRYLQKRLKMTGNTVSKVDGKIFIGHGHSAAWRDLKDFIHERLGLPWDEFNREATAGMSTKERLQQMLDDASFAFLVMTGEDERVDGARTARASVVHEVGLFQGRLGFQRAIVLLEEGCEEFSNIVGLSQIRFPKNSMRTVFEEVRRVLERERILPR